MNFKAIFYWTKTYVDSLNLTVDYNNLSNLIKTFLNIWEKKHLRRHRYIKFQDIIKFEDRKF